jgi:hypothetical protein
MCILERDSILEQNGQGSLALLSRWLLLKVLEAKFLKILKVVCKQINKQYTKQCLNSNQIVAEDYTRCYKCESARIT